MTNSARMMTPTAAAVPWNSLTMKTARWRMRIPAPPRAAIPTSLNIQQAAPVVPDPSLFSVCLPEQQSMVPDL